MTADVLEIDSFKLLHWLNARKLTAAMAADRVGLDETRIGSLARGDTGPVPRADAVLLARALDVPIGELLVDADRAPAVLFRTKSEIESTRRSLNRGGFHYYDYCTLPSPQGFIAPVLIDILCPQDREPVQNNGHLEPAITINLGPGPINGLWGDKTNPDAWHPLRANGDPRLAWIAGDSYVEPPYRPHTYSLASDRPARILSYTVKSNLEPIVHATNGWPDRSFATMVARFEERPAFAAVLRMAMERRGYVAATLGAALGLGANALTAYLEGDAAALALDDLKPIGRVLGVDYRTLMPADHVHDSVGKTMCTVADSIASIRPYRSYAIASMSGAPQHTDMMGVFMKVDKPAPAGELDLIEHSGAHYLVTGGAMTLRWRENGGKTGERPLAAGDGFWIAPFVAHAVGGRGSLIKMGNGEGLNYLQLMEFTNTYDVARTLRRCRHDRRNWGYDAA